MFVLTHEPPHDPEDAEITFLTSRTRDAVATVRAAAGERSVEIFGATTAQGVLREGLLDEVVIHLAPVCSATGCGSTATGCRRSRSSARSWSRRGN